MDNREVLLVDESFAPILTEKECEDIKPIIRDFIESYTENKDVPVDQWMCKKMQEYLPEKSANEIEAIVKEITYSLQISEQKKAFLTEAVENGRSKESWFASEVQKATSVMSMEKTKEYLGNLDKAVKDANDKFLYETLLTKSGDISRLGNLDGFIAEQYHAQTFNMNAESAGSPYRAKVIQPEGKGYAKNGVDLVVIDTRTGKIVKRYQAKYYKSARETLAAFKAGNYRGQQKLVPLDQKNDIEAKATDVIISPDGVRSNPLSKSKAQQMKEDAQSGNWKDLDWNEFQIRNLAKGIGKQVGYAAVQGAAIGVGFDLAKKVWDGDEIDGKDVVEMAIKSGADSGIKSAAAGAIKVGVEKDIIKGISKGTPLSTISNIAFVAVENIKVLGKVATGELTASEGVEKMAQTTVSTAAGGIGAAQGTVKGTIIGGIALGPVGAALGGFIGGTVGYIAGSKVGETVFNGAKKVAKKSKEIIGRAVEGIKNMGSSIMSGIRSLLPW